MHEPDFDKAEGDARRRADRSQYYSVSAVQETATVEYLYDEVQRRQDTVKARTDKASRKEKARPEWQMETALQEMEAAEAARPMLKQAKMSIDAIQVARAGTEVDKVYVKEKLDRFPGVLRSLGGKILTGILSAALGFLTFGTVGVKGNVSGKGYMGQGLQKKGWPIKATFLNDIRAQIAQFRTAVTSRPAGPSAVDVTSAILRAFNEIVVQNVINIAGKLALITGLLATVLSMAAAATFGATAPVAAILATISSIATYVAVIAAVVKALVSAVRFTLDGLSMLLNKDAKLSNFVRARAAQSTMEAVNDVVQAGTSAVGPSTSEAIKGREFFNIFDPKQLVNANVSALTAASVPLGKTIGAVAASSGPSVGGPLITGTVVPGIVGGASERYGLYTQHPDEMGMQGPTKAGGGFLPPSGQKNRLQSQATPSKGGNMPIDPTLPPWMQKAVEEQNRLRSQVLKGTTSKAASEVEGVSSKVGDLGGKLGIGKSESEKLKQHVDEAKSSPKGKDLISPEDSEMAEEQQGVLSDSHGAVGEMLMFLTHSKKEMVKINEERQKD